MNDDIPSCKLGMTDSPSPSDTSALTEGGYGELLERLGNLATYLAMAAGHEDEIGTVDDAQVAITALQAEIQRYRSMFDAAGNYIPHSQIEGDLRAARAEVAALLARAETAEKEAANLTDMLEGSRTAHRQDNVALIKAEAAIEEVRVTLAAWDINSLPKDMSLQEVAEARVEDLQKYMNLAEASQARIDALTAEVARLREALLPFGAAAEFVAEYHPGWDHDAFNIGGSLGAVVIMADFRRARAALSPVKQETNNG